MIKSTLTIVTALFVTLTYSQVQVRLVDEHTQKPIEGVQVLFKSLVNDQNEVKISDRNGLTSSGLSLPLLLQLSHVSYTSRQDTLYSANQQISLQPATLSLQEVIVTGQYTPQSAKNAVNKIKSIGSERIEAQGAATLQDVLANELNIQFSRDNALGTSGLTLQGLSGQNVKVLIDGVPMVGRSGVANEIDINQINVNSIDRVEIVEGPMAVNFGADALAGVINIITKKEGMNKWQMDLALHEESVGDEYSFFDEGIHSPSLTFGFKPSDEWYVQGETRINHFGGWIGNGTDRDRQWYPKTQYFAGGLARFTKDNVDIYYRLDYLDEVIENLGGITNQDNPNEEPFSTNQDYVSQRWMHQVQANIQLGDWQLNPVVSYTDYNRVTQEYTTFLTSGFETNPADVQDTYFDTWFTRNTISKTAGSWGSFQLGVEGTFDRAGGTRLSAGEKTGTDIAFFGSAEFKINQKLALRPGIRYGYNSIFSAEPAPSLNLKYDFTSNTQLRVGYGRGFRAPSLRELYHEFIDSNHNIVGNADLVPEYSHNVNADLTHKFPLLNLTTSVSGFYNYKENQIVFLPPPPERANEPTSYTNLTTFKTTGGRITGTWKKKDLQVSPGVAYTGVYQRLSESEEGVSNFVFGWEANTNITYTWRAPKITVSTFYKFNGPFREYRLQDGEPELQQLDAFHLLDVTLSKKIGSTLQLSLGSRNMLNVGAVDNSFSTGGAHNGNTGQTSVGTGRSYFARLNIKLQSNN